MTVDIGALRESLHPRPHIRPAALVPALLVVVLALASAEPDRCQSTDGPQFECYLRQASSH